MISQPSAWDLLNTRYYCWHYIETDKFTSILEKLTDILKSTIFTGHSAQFTELPSWCLFSLIPASWLLTPDIWGGLLSDSWASPGAASCLPDAAEITDLVLDHGSHSGAGVSSWAGSPDRESWILCLTNFPHVWVLENSALWLRLLHRLVVSPI